MQLEADIVQFLTTHGDHSVNEIATGIKKNCMTVHRCLAVMFYDGKVSRKKVAGITKPFIFYHLEDNKGGRMT